MSKQYGKQKIEHRKALLEREKQKNRVILTGMIAGGVILAGILAVSMRTDYDVDLTGQPVTGQADAPHTLVVIGDLKCPACKTFEETTQQDVDRAVQAGQLKRTFLHYPFLARTLPEDDSLLMARAAECGYQRGGSQLHDQIVRGLYRQQGNEQGVWGGKTQLPGLLGAAGLNRDDTQAVMTCATGTGPDADTAAAAVKLDQQIAGQARLQGTPLVLLDGQRIMDARNLNRTLQGYLR